MAFRSRISRDTRLANRRVSQTDDLLKAMVANPTMIAAYKSGIPGNGKPFPDGSKIPRLSGNREEHRAPFAVRIPGGVCRMSS